MTGARCRLHRPAQRRMARSARHVDFRLLKSSDDLDRARMKDLLQWLVRSILACLFAARKQKHVMSPSTRLWQFWMLAAQLHVKFICRGNASDFGGSNGTSFPAWRRATGRASLETSQFGPMVDGFSLRLRSGWRVWDTQAGAGAQGWQFDHGTAGSPLTIVASRNMAERGMICAR